MVIHCFVVIVFEQHMVKWSKFIPTLPANGDCFPDLYLTDLVPFLLHLLACWRYSWELQLSSTRHLRLAFSATDISDATVIDWSCHCIVDRYSSATWLDQHHRVHRPSSTTALASFVRHTVARLEHWALQDRYHHEAWLSFTTTAVSPAH